MLKIQRYEVDVDFEKELRQFDWNRPRWKENKLICCSPFREETNPSFAVSYDYGGAFIDSGGEGEWRSGGFVKLLSWLRNETREETELYLLSKYHIIGFVDEDDMELTFDNWEVKEKVDELLTFDILDQYAFIHPYLEKKRGIKEIYQRALRIGFDAEKKAVSFPILDKNGNLVNIKFRSVRSKVFWYYNNNKVRDHLYLLFLVRQKKAKTVFLVESEIDAITLFMHGFPAIAVMGSSMTKKQRSLILDSGIETLILATDNDKAGRRLSRSIVDQLGGFLELKELEFPQQYKDVNDLPASVLLECVENLKEVVLNN